MSTGDRQRVFTRGRQRVSTEGRQVVYWKGDRKATGGREGVSTGWR